MFKERQAVRLYSAQPFNAAADPQLLRQSYITPNDLFFTRNHGEMPTIDPFEYRLTVDGLVRQPLTLSLDDLRRHFPQQSLTLTLSCAGNRRQELNAVSPVTHGEICWDAGAISTAVWRGVPLYAVLREAGIGIDARHVAFQGLDCIRHNGTSFGFGSSVPLSKVLTGNVLFAYEMNGEPLPQAHGFPLRVIVPGVIGARSVKWLSTITLQREPSQNYYQRHAYKLFPPTVSSKTADWEQGIPLSEVGLNSVICHPADGDVLERGWVEVQGYAIAGEHTRVEQVELSTDGGRSWIEAETDSPSQLWAWRFWQAQLWLARGEHQLVVRATDSNGRTQPASLAEVWNFKGYANNARHRVSIEVV